MNKTLKGIFGVQLNVCVQLNLVCQYVENSVRTKFKKYDKKTKKKLFFMSVYILNFYY